MKKKFWKHLFFLFWIMMMMIIYRFTTLPPPISNPWVLSIIQLLDLFMIYLWLPMWHPPLCLLSEGQLPLCEAGSTILFYFINKGLLLELLPYHHSCGQVNLLLSPVPRPGWHYVFQQLTLIFERQLSNTLSYLFRLTYWVYWNSTLLDRGQFVFILSSPET